MSDQKAWIGTAGESRLSSKVNQKPDLTFNRKFNFKSEVPKHICGKLAQLNRKQWEKLAAWISHNAHDIQTLELNINEVVSLARLTNGQLSAHRHRARENKNDGRVPTRLDQAAVLMSHCPLGRNSIDQNSLREAAKLADVLLECLQETKSDG